MTDQLLLLAREALLLTVVISAPPALASLVMGLIVGLLQATTQIQEQTLSMVPRGLAVYGSLVVAGPWIGGELLRFTRLVFDTIAQVV